jgi:hypothetical protein
MSTSINSGDARVYAVGRDDALAQVAKLPLVKVVPLERYLVRRHDGRGFAPEFLTQKAAEDYLLLRGLLTPRDTCTLRAHEEQGTKEKPSNPLRLLGLPGCPRRDSNPSGRGVAVEAGSYRK